MKRNNTTCPTKDFQVTKCLEEKVKKSGRNIGFNAPQKQGEKKNRTDQRKQNLARRGEKKTEGQRGQQGRYQNTWGCGKLGLWARETPKLRDRT